MYTVCENCWMAYPQINPTAPNKVIIIRDNFSAFAWPSKSYKELINGQAFRYICTVYHMSRNFAYKIHVWIKCGLLLNQYVYIFPVDVF